MQNKDHTLATDFTSGSIPKQMLRFAVPFMLSNGFQVLYSLVDMLVVGRYVGSFGLSAVSIASQVFTLLTMLGLGFSTGGQVYVAQLLGMGRKDRLNAVVGTLFTTVGVMGVIVTAVGLAFGRGILFLLDTPSQSFDMALDYVLVCSVGMLFSYGYNMVSAVLRGMGDSKHPFAFILIASVINIVLDLLFVAGFRWSVFGAALATIIGQAVSFLYSLVFLYRRREAFGFDFRPRSFAVDWQALAVIIRLGLPFAMQSAAINVSMLFVNRLVNGVGDHAVYASATLGVGLKIDDIVNKVSQGISFAVSSMVGQNIAARKPERIRQILKYAWIFAACCYGTFTVCLLLFRVELFSLFTDDAPVIALSEIFVSAIVWSFPAMALLRGINGFVQGIGNARLGLILSLTDALVFRILLSWGFGIALGFGLFGFFLGYGLGAYGTVIPGLVYFAGGRWKHRALLERCSDPDSGVGGSEPVSRF